MTAATTSKPIALLTIFVVLASFCTAQDEKIEYRRKRSFDRIDGYGFGSLVKRPFDMIDAHSFSALNKRAFDRIDSSGFGLYKRAFDRIDSGNLMGLYRKRRHSKQMGIN